jgi:5-methylcytosine-specific restriction endonuclease McrA
MNRPFTPFDIIWIKNVTSKNGQAYMDVSSDNFVLHFPTKHKTNAGSPLVGEIILLYQKINGQKVFTYLVTPIDKNVDENNRTDYRYGRNVRIIAATPLSNLITVSSTRWDNINFQGISQGNACKIENISNIGNYDILLEDIWNKFTPYFRSLQKNSLRTTDLLNEEIETEDPNLTVTEGRLRLITHYARERNRDIVRKKKQQALANGNLHCETCGFSCRDTYGVEFIECHHLTQISQAGVRETTLDDLALVCSNCHRMLHKLIDEQFLSVEQLKEKIRTSTQHLLADNGG